MDAARNARYVRDSLPPGGLFADQHWRIAPAPFPLDKELVEELETLGRVLLQFYRAVNLLYRRSIEGKAPEWVAQLLDQGKTAELIALQREAAFRQEVPRVIRPDVLLTEGGFVISELDSVPGGIGLTQWLNQTYEEVRTNPASLAEELQPAAAPVIGGMHGMRDGFQKIFGDAKRVCIVVSEESSSYRPEMEWLAANHGAGRMVVVDQNYTDFAPGDSVYRFFELFDLPNIPSAQKLFELAASRTLRVTPPPKPIFEEKLLFALLWNRNLHSYFRQELGEGFLKRLLKVVPQTWILDPAPLPPLAAYPGLDLTDWRQLQALSQRERDLILKVSGFSQDAWGARGVYLGSDLSSSDWAAAVEQALKAWPSTVHVLQRYHKPRSIPSQYYDFEQGTTVPMPGRARLCPYYFVAGEGDAAKPQLGGILATICPADKKIIHGMKDAILAPCAPATE